MEKKDEYIKSRKFEMSVSVSYFSRFALKSPSKASALFSNESFSNRFGRWSLLNSPSSIEGCLYIQPTTIYSLSLVISINVDSYCLGLSV